MRKVDNETLEGNKLIAEFRGLQTIVCNGELCHYKSMFTVQYHTSWDWLMPVVEKIEEKYTTDLHSFFEWNGTGYDVKHRFTISNVASRIAPKITIESDSKIKAVWIAVIEFIKRVNNETK